MTNLEVIRELYRAFREVRPVEGQKLWLKGFLKRSVTTGSRGHLT